MQADHRLLVPSIPKLGLCKPQESLSVQMTDLLFIRRADGGVIQKGSSLLIHTEGIIDREQDAIGPHHLHGEQQRWIGEKAAGRNMEVVQKVLGHRVLQLLCQGREHVINTRQHKRNHLSHMPDDDLQGWLAIEHPGQDQSQRMDTHFGVPAPAERR
jgi:hypothetical protein